MTDREPPHDGKDRATQSVARAKTHHKKKKKKKKKKNNVSFAESKNKMSVPTLSNTEAGFQKGTLPSFWSPLAVLKMIHQILF